MKKNFHKLIAFLALVIIMFIAIISFGFARNKEKFKEATVDKMLETVEEKKEMIVYFGQEDCSACAVFSDILMDLKKRTKQEIFYLDANSLDENEKRVLEEYYVSETPTLIVISKGDMVFYRNLTVAEDIEKALSNLNIEKERINSVEIIDFDELEQKFQAGTDFFIYIGREDCRDCAKFFPILEQYVGDGINRGMYYLDVKEYRDLAQLENANEEDIDFYEKIKEEFDIEWVPSIYHVRNNIIVSKYEFLSEEFYRLDSDEQKEQEQMYIEDFYMWMEKELK
ncbi:MAG: thioredoxin family protein [Roseburia sp.]|nr:thioredoxin family protein [Roseburia sp.]MCM1279007.1 thioredoxin family protein [Robinsoniella sp.]